MTDIKSNIKKLLENEHISNYKISKATGIAQTTLSDYSTGKSQIGNMKLDHAIKLNKYYLNIREDLEMNFKELSVYHEKLNITKEERDNKDEKPKSASNTKEKVMLSLEFNAIAASKLGDGKYPLWMKLAYDAVSKMDLEALTEGRNYTFRINPKSINLITQEITWDGNVWYYKDVKEETIYEGKTYGYVEIN